MRVVTLIPGDGIGPEVVRAARRAVDATGAHIEWEEVDAGLVAFERCGTPLPPETVSSLRRNGVALKGPITLSLKGRSKQADPYPNPIRLMFKEINAFAQVRLAYHFEGSKSGIPGTALVVVRELTEGLGMGPQDRLGDDAAFSMKIITRAASERVCRFCFEFARSNGYKHVTVGHLKNAQRIPDGLFLQVASDVASGYPEIELSDEGMDSLCQNLVMRPATYQVLLGERSYGGILSGLTSGLAGSVGLMPGGNFGPSAAIFEAGHGSAPKHAGLNRANPVGVILSGAMLLDYIGESAAASRLRQAVRKAIQRGTLTYDLGGNTSTDGMADAIVEELGRSNS